MNAKKDEITIKKLWDIFRPMLWLIAIVSLVLGAAFGIYSEFFKADEYSTTGKFMVIKVPYEDDDSSTTGLNSNEILAMQGMIANAKEIINTNDFCENVKRALGTDLSANQIKSTMSISLCNSETTCYYFKVTSDDPRLSYEIADVAGELLRSNVQNMGYAIRVDRIDSPSIPSGPDSKNSVRNFAIGFAIGFILSALAVFIRSRFDVVIRTKEKLESNFDIPVLGVIPRPESNN